MYGIASRSEWRLQSIDLSAWKGQNNIRVRFRLATDGDAGTTGDGWFVDDVAVREHAPLTIPYPFYDGFEGDLSSWLSAGWTRTTNTPYAGTGSLVDGEFTRIGPDVQHYLVLAGDLDLTTAVAPKLTFWAKAKLNYRSWFRVDVSLDEGISWSELGGVGASYTVNNPWTRQQVDLFV